ncbi:MAG: hypothetical protein LBK53_09840 [Heliobacteriaceae bacterium]|nr:hypothetical protein [Heliobacteriaceae bacterium]
MSTQIGKLLIRKFGNGNTARVMTQKAGTETRTLIEILDSKGSVINHKLKEVTRIQAKSDSCPLLHEMYPNMKQFEFTKIHNSEIGPRGYYKQLDDGTYIGGSRINVTGIPNGENIDRVVVARMKQFEKEALVYNEAQRYNDPVYVNKLQKNNKFDFSLDTSKNLHRNEQFSKASITFENDAYARFQRNNLVDEFIGSDKWKCDDNIAFLFGTPQLLRLTREIGVKAQFNPCYPG